MTVKSDSISQKLSIKKLKDIKLNTAYFRLKPTKLLRQNSMFTNQDPYLKRSIRINAYKGDVRSQLISRQSYECPICNGLLLDFEGLDLSINAEDFIFIRGKYVDSLMTVLAKDNSFESKVSRNSLMNQYVDGKVLYQSLRIDHILPHIIGKFDDRISAKLDEISNKAILHSSCYKIKAAFDKKTFIRE